MNNDIYYIPDSKGGRKFYRKLPKHLVYSPRFQEAHPNYCLWMPVKKFLWFWIATGKRFWIDDYGFKKL